MRKSDESGIIALLIVSAMLGISLTLVFMLSGTSTKNEMAVQDLSAQATDLETIVAKMLDFSLRVRPVNPANLPSIASIIHPGLAIPGLGVNPLLPSPTYPLSPELNLRMIFSIASPLFLATDTADTPIKHEVAIRKLVNPAGSPNLDLPASWETAFAGTALIDNPPATAVYQDLVIQSINLTQYLVMSTNTSAPLEEGNRNRRKVKAKLKIVTVPSLALRNLGISTVFIREIEMIGATAQHPDNSNVFTHLSRDNGSLKSMCIEWDLGLSDNPFVAPAVGARFLGRYWVPPVLYYLRDNCTQEYLAVYFGTEWCATLLHPYPWDQDTGNSVIAQCICNILNRDDTISSVYFPGQKNLQNVVLASPLPAPWPSPSPAYPPPAINCSTWSRF